jgi:hypothetical protein
MCIKSETELRPKFDNFCNSLQSGAKYNQESYRCECPNGTVSAIGKCVAKENYCSVLYGENSEMKNGECSCKDGYKNQFTIYGKTCVINKNPSESKAEVVPIKIENEKTNLSLKDTTKEKEDLLVEQAVVEKVTPQEIEVIKTEIQKKPAEPKKIIWYKKILHFFKKK